MSEYGKKMTELAIKNSTSYKGKDSVIHSPHNLKTAHQEKAIKGKIKKVVQRGDNAIYKGKVHSKMSHLFGMDK
jgi:hypothetical protein